jgi:hypothetical protein
MIVKVWATLIGFCLSFHLLGGSAWPSIPPEVWALKAGPKGAVILEDRMRFTYLSVEYVYRVRIFAEEGRAAAEIPDLPSSLTSMKGRTVYPDGRQVEFNSRKDFAERRIESGGDERRQTHLVAPGVTSDCVVEFQWSESADGLFRGLPKRYSDGLYSSWMLINRFPTQVMSIEVAQPFPLAWSLNPGGVRPPEASDSWNRKGLTFKDLPAIEEPPYSLRPTLRAPSLVVFWQPDDLRRFVGDGPDAYWNRAIKEHYKEAYEDGIEKGGAFKAFSIELTTNLPAGPTKAAMALLERLDARIANLSHATFAESADLPKDFWKDFSAKDLATAVKQGRTNSRGMRLLFYHLLKAAGLKPVIAKVPDREVSLFSWTHLNPWQFHADLIGVEEAGGGMMWFDPSNRFATPGVVHPDYTAVPALIVNTATWTGSRGVVGSLGANANIRRYTYRLDLEEDADRFQVDSEFAGYPEYVERNRYMALEPKEQSKLLKETFEKAMKNLAVTGSEVKNTSDAKASVTWQLKGSLERESSRRRAVDPFPGMPWPLWVPSKLEEVRTVPIVLPYQATQLAVSSFTVPKGYTMGQHQELQQQNGFGKVFWVPSYDAATRTGKVVLRVEVSTVSASASQWAQFRQFLTWIEDACRRQIVLTREG